MDGWRGEAVGGVVRVFLHPLGAFGLDEGEDPIIGRDRLVHCGDAFVEHARLNCAWTHCPSRTIGLISVFHRFRLFYGRYAG